MAGRFSSRLCRLIIEPEPNLVGRWWEMSAIEGMLERAVDGHGAVVSVMGSPGMGKSVVREMAAMARRRDVEVFTALCESHTSQEKLRPIARRGFCSL